MKNLLFFFYSFPELKNVTGQKCYHLTEKICSLARLDILNWENSSFLFHFKIVALNFTSSWFNKLGWKDWQLRVATKLFCSYETYEIKIDQAVVDKTVVDETVVDETVVDETVVKLEIMKIDLRKYVSG